MLAACSTMPGTGPYTRDIEGAIGNPYALIDLDQGTAGAVNTYVTAHRKEPPVVLPLGRPIGLVGPGDLLQIAIWQPDPTGASLTADKTGLTTATQSRDRWQHQHSLCRASAGHKPHANTDRTRNNGAVRASGAWRAGIGAGDRRSDQRRHCPR